MTKTTCSDMKSILCRINDSMIYINVLNNITSTPQVTHNLDDYLAW